MSKQTGNDSADSATTTDTGEATPSELGEDAPFDAIAAAAEFTASLREPMAGLEGDPNGESYLQILESEVESLTALVATREAAARKAHARAEQAMAEIDGSKQRLARDSSRELERRLRDILLAFVEVLDDFDRALAAARQTDHNPEVVGGIELVHKRFLAVLGRFGVSHQPALGEPFDPNLHDAVSTLSTPTAADHGRVIAVVHEGYLIDGVVLRAAGVVVGRKSS